MLSAVITCYKDAEAIPVMHARLTAVFTALSVEYEIIFVNDASPDAADSVLKGLTASDERVIAIEHSRNFGSQSAFLSGMQVAIGDAVILLDGDLQDPPELITEFYAEWRKGHHVVYGRRRQREGSALLAFLCRVFYRIFRGISYVPIPLDAGDFALLDRKVVSELLALPETDQFLRGLRAWVGFNQTGVDYVRPERPFGRSTHGWLANVWWAKKAIFSFSFVPISVLGYLACALTALSVLLGGYQVLQAICHPERDHQSAILIIVVMFFGSLNLLAVAIIGEYLVKVFEEAKRRPKFIRKAIRQGRDLFDTAPEMDVFLRGRSRGVASRRALSTEHVDSDED
jgi:glycosyltransferase involved in cell wall biosynthesis